MMDNNTNNLGFTTTGEELRRLHTIVGDLEGKFREQRLMLQRQGMSLPPGTLGGLQDIRDKLQRIEANYGGSDSELEQLRALIRTGELLNSTLGLDAVLDGVMDTVISLTGAERGYLVLRNLETGQMEFRVARNIEQRNLVEEEFYVSNTVVKQVAQTGKPLLAMNAMDDKRLSDNLSVIRGALRSILCVPLLVKGHVTGVIYTDNRLKYGQFDEQDQQSLQAFANQAAAAIENARLFESVRASLAEITALRDLLENIFASIASGVITTDIVDRITRLNDAACRILFLEAHTSLGQVMWDILPPLHEQLAEIVQAVRTHNQEQMLEVVQVFDQRTSNLNLKLSPLRNAARITEGVAIVVDDLTELRERQAQLEVVRRYLTPAMVDNIDTIDKLGLGGERRTVTCLYIDVRAFNTFPALQPQELMTMLNSYLTVAADAISQQDGVIDKYMATVIMALFNTQLNPFEDHAYHAVQAALNIANEYREFYRRTGVPEGVTHYRIGIHTGVATLGNVGSETRREFTAIGDTINLAARLLENASPGQIVISEETALQCGTRFQEALPDIHIKGLEELEIRGRTVTTKVYRVPQKSVQ